MPQLLRELASVFHASASSVSFSLKFVRVGRSPSPQPSSPPPPLRLGHHEFICHICNQNFVIICLIRVFGPTFRVSYSLLGVPGSRVVATLQDCLNLQRIIQGGFCLIDIPPHSIWVQAEGSHKRFHWLCHVRRSIYGRVYFGRVSVQA